MKEIETIQWDQGKRTTKWVLVPQKRSLKCLMTTMAKRDINDMVPEGPMGEGAPKILIVLTVHMARDINMDIRNDKKGWYDAVF